MKLELGTQKVLLTGGVQDAAETIRQAVAEGNVDVVIWIRDLNLDASPVNGSTKLDAGEPAIPTDRRSHASLWRETMGY